MARPAEAGLLITIRRRDHARKSLEPCRRHGWPSVGRRRSKAWIGGHRTPSWRRSRVSSIGTRTGKRVAVGSIGASW